MKTAFIALATSMALSFSAEASLLKLQVGQKSLLNFQD